MQVTVSYNIDNDRKFRNALIRAGEQIGDLRVPFGLILADFYRSEQAIFKLSGPGQYPPFQGKTLSDGNTAYQRRKKKMVGFDYPLLVKSGALAASVLGPSNPSSIAEIGPLSLIFGTSIPYGVYHQSDAPRTKIPLRKFLFIGPESQFNTSETAGRTGRWLNILNDAVLRNIRVSGVAK